MLIGNALLGAVFNKWELKLIIPSTKAAYMCFAVSTTAARSALISPFCLYQRKEEQRDHLV